MVNDAVFSELTPVPYAVAKDQICNGDLMLCSGTGFVSDAIKRATKSDFSHVALVLKLHESDQWLVAESVESHGVRCVALEPGYLQNYMGTGKGYPGKIIIVRHESMPAQLDKLYHQAFALMGNR
jgi:hypothetical protein